MLTLASVRLLCVDEQTILLGNYRKSLPLGLRAMCTRMKLVVGV
jgi:hypothetical protein